MEHTLVAKLNLNHPLEPEELANLSDHSNIYGQLRRLYAVCETKKDFILLEGICERCPASMSLTVKMREDPCLKHLIKHSQVLARLTKLVVGILEMYPDPKDLPSLQRVCQLCPTLELDLRVNGFVEEELINYPEIIKRLTELGVDYAMADNFPSLENICRSHPVKLKLNVEYPFRELCGHPEILSRLTELRVVSPTNEGGIGWLNDICKMSPNLTNVGLVLNSGLKSLNETTLLLSRLESLFVHSPEERDIALCNSICKRCPKLQQWGCKIPLSLVKCVLQECPAVAHIECLMPHSTYVTVSKRKCDMEMVCRVPHLPELLQQIDNLQSLRKLTLAFTEMFDETSPTFPLLRDLSERSPNLRFTETQWHFRGEARPAELPGLVDEAMNGWRRRTHPQESS